MAPSTKIRVLIADDSAFMRKVLHSILLAEPGFEVVGEARDGREAVTQTEALKPDVVTMDINMPHLDGLQATEQIMSTNPRPIVVVSSESREGAEITLKALELGAIDFVAKPSSGVDLDMSSVRDELVRKLRVAAKVRVVRTASRTKLGHEVASSAPRTDPTVNPAVKNEPPRASGTNAPSTRSYSKFPLIVIAASTGGPATLMKLVPSFPRELPGAVIIIQHMPGTFTAQFSQQLSESCAIRIKEAESGEILAPATVYICPGSHHLRVSPTGRVTLDDGPRILGYRPCADVTLETAAEYAGPMCIGVVLTGMGNDGTRGAQAVKDAGGLVLAQDEATSVIFGMNAEAIRAGVVNEVLPIDAMLAAIEKRISYVHGAAKAGAR
ncbi:MAG TPA: chemotaxis response regulator protein-glutamate methylesterase [Terriglobales bacterium]|jgi:two-component system chemotaxis response regulator CheB|nr:chemotaxis response regulator protein-glutamate methylesterase [Terriglobales bacterium]